MAGPCQKPSTSQNLRTSGPVSFAAEHRPTAHLLTIDRSIIDTDAVTKTVRLLLRLVLMVGFLGCLLAQIVVLPILASESARVFPEVASLRIPYLAGAIMAVGCVQLCIVAIWRLLDFVARETVFRVSSLRWVDVVIWSAAVSAAIVLGLGSYLLGTAGGGPGVLLLTAAGATVGTGIALLMLVMRRLLLQAIRDRDELAEVI